MKVFTTSTGVQEIVVIPRREETDIILTIIDEADNTNNLQDFTTASNANGYMTISFSFDGFIEGNSYFIEINAQNVVVGTKPLLWRGKGFCTDQTDLQEYKLVNEVNDPIVII